MSKRQNNNTRNDIHVVIALALTVAVLSTIPTSAVVHVAIAQEEDNGGREEVAAQVLELTDPQQPEAVKNNEDNSGAEVSENLTYNDVNRAEVITDQGQVINPGGNEPDTAAAEATTTAQTQPQQQRYASGYAQNTLAKPSLDDGSVISNPSIDARAYNPPSISMQEYTALQDALKMAGYSFSDGGTIYTTLFGDDRRVLVLIGNEGVTSQPSPMFLEEIGKSWGYQMVISDYSSKGELITVFVEAF